MDQAERLLLGPKTAPMTPGEKAEGGAPGPPGVAFKPSGDVAGLSPKHR